MSNRARSTRSKKLPEEPLSQSSARSSHRPPGLSGRDLLSAEYAILYDKIEKWKDSVLSANGKDEMRDAGMNLSAGLVSDLSFRFNY